MATDDKDWTWVLEQQCSECGYRADELHRDALGARVRSVGGSWRELLGRGPAVEMLRDDDDRTWTPLEYGCHVRDVFKLFQERTKTMLKKRKPPTFKDWNQEHAAVEGDYKNADRDKVAYELASNAGKYADLLDRLNDDEWSKQGTRSDGAEFTVESLARYMLHDVEHHLWDAREQLG